MSLKFRIVPFAAVMSVLGCLLATSVAQAADLSIAIAGHQVSGGKIRASLYNSAQTFAKEFFKAIDTEASGESVVLVFRDLPPGSYAVTAYQDVNGDGKLERGIFNQPSEPYGVSRDARGKRGPPKFEDAQIELREPSSQISITLR